MARNRMIKVEFWSDEKIGKLSLLARLLFIGTWNYADDSGICRANPIYLKNQIFPYDEKIKTKQIQEALTELSVNNQIKLIEYSNESYLIINKFLDHQVINRASKYRYINDIENVSYINHGTLTEHSFLKVKVKEKENEKAKDMFCKFWECYPKKQSKEEAKEKWLKLNLTDELFNKIIDSLDKFKTTEQWQKDNGRYIPHPATWINKKRWEDEVKIDNINESPYREY